MNILDAKDCVSTSVAFSSNNAKLATAKWLMTAGCYYKWGSEGESSQPLIYVVGWSLSESNSR